MCVYLLGGGPNLTVEECLLVGGQKAGGCRERDGMD